MNELKLKRRKAPDHHQFIEKSLYSEEIPKWGIECYPVKPVAAARQELIDIFTWGALDITGRPKKNQLDDCLLFFRKKVRSDGGC